MQKAAVSLPWSHCPCTRNAGIWQPASIHSITDRARGAGSRNEGSCQRCRRVHSEHAAGFRRKRQGSTSRRQLPHEAWSRPVQGQGWPDGILSTQLLRQDTDVIMCIQVASLRVPSTMYRWCHVSRFACMSSQQRLHTVSSTFLIKQCETTAPSQQRTKQNLNRPP
jgi:hypothetical protein